MGIRVRVDACTVERLFGLRAICDPTTGPCERGRNGFLIAAANPDRRSAPSSTLVAVAADGSARMTSAVPSGSEPNCSRTRGRRRRVTRWRTTELPTFAETTKPARAGSCCCVVSTCTTRRLVPARRPPLTTAAKSSAARRRAPAGSTMRRSVGDRPEIRPRSRCGPCGDEPKESNDRHESAYADGSRGPWPGDGCSVGRCACSR